MLLVLNWCGNLKYFIQFVNCSLVFSILKKESTDCSIKIVSTFLYFMFLWSIYLEGMNVYESSPYWPISWPDRRRLSLSNQRTLATPWRLEECTNHSPTSGRVIVLGREIVIVFLEDGWWKRKFGVRFFELQTADGTLTKG